MANIDAPFGARPFYHGSGGTPARTNEYDLASGYGTAIFQGDWVSQTTDGTIIRTAAGDTTAVLGVFNGVRYRATNGEYVYSNQWVASTATFGSENAKVIVYDDPNTRFMMQAHANFVQADVGQFVQIVATAGDTSSGISRESLGDAAGGSEAQMRINRVLSVPARADTGHGNSIVGAYAIVEVMPVTHQLAGTHALEV